MENTNNNNPLHIRQGKDTKEQVFKTPTENHISVLTGTHNATASMVSAATGIPQKNICKVLTGFRKGRATLGN